MSKPITMEEVIEALQDRFSMCYSGRNYAEEFTSLPLPRDAWCAADDYGYMLWLVDQLWPEQWETAFDAAYAESKQADYERLCLERCDRIRTAVPWDGLERRIRKLVREHEAQYGS